VEGSKSKAQAAYPELVEGSKSKAQAAYPELVEGVKFRFSIFRTKKFALFSKFFGQRSRRTI
ncbi:MAG: hypothetical protein WC329_07310, partial [Candidatus Omnitrophota bacterium]